MADKAPLTIEDFKKTKNLGEFTEKLKEVTSLEFLSELEAWEKETGARKGAVSAINERQGELLDRKKEFDALKESATIADDEQQEGTGTTGDAEIKLDSDYQPVLNQKGETIGPDDEVPSTYEDVHGLEGTQEQPPLKDSEGNLLAPDNENGTQDLHVEGKLTLNGPGNGIANISPRKTKAKLAEEVKDHRLEIDRIYQFAQHHLRISTGCESPLFKAKAWLGILLSTLGTKNPYEVGKIETPSQIPATAEKNEGTDFILKRQEFSNLNPIPAIQRIREEIQEVAELVDDLELLDIPFGSNKRARRANICKTQAWVNLSEARFELGQDLARIRG